MPVMITLDYYMVKNYQGIDQLASYCIAIINSKDIIVIVEEDIVRIIEYMKYLKPIMLDILILMLMDLYPIKQEEE